MHDKRGKEWAVTESVLSITVAVFCEPYWTIVDRKQSKPVVAIFTWHVAEHVYWGAKINERVHGEVLSI